MTRGIEMRGFMKNSISVLHEVVPDLISVLTNRFRILEVIHEQGPIGRRILAETLQQSERTLRTETDFLRKNGLVTSSKTGMELTHRGVRAFHDMESIMDRLLKMNAKEELLAKKLKLQLCRIVPGNVDEDINVLDVLGIQATDLFDELLPEGDFIVAVAGGSTMAAMARYMTTDLSEHRHFTFVPARGGVGESMSIQANSVSDQMAQATGGENFALFAPDNLSIQALDLLRNEPSISRTMDRMDHANCLLYSIGNAKVMMDRRSLTDEEQARLIDQDVVGEAFGCFFDKKGNIIHRLSRFGLQIEDVERIPYAIAIAGGKSKASAIQAYSQFAPEHTWLVTDEGAANSILKGKTL